MRILFVGWYPNPVEPYKNCFFQSAVHAIADLGHECTVISPVSICKYASRITKIPSYIMEETKSGSRVDVHYPRILSASSKRIGPLNTGMISEWLFEFGARFAARRLEHRQYDAVYGHFFLFGGLAAIKIARGFKVPCFVAYGECDYQSQILEPFRDLRGSDLNGLSGIISVSDSNTNQLHNRVAFRNIPIETIPNAVDTNQFYPMDSFQCKRAMEFPTDRPIVGFVGGFIPRKGDLRLLEACKNNTRVYLAFAGKGSHKPEGENVIYCDAVPREQMPVFMNAIDMLALPTLNEGCCNAILEAMACGKPIISSNLPFNYGIVDSSRGVLVDPLDIGQIADAVNLLLNNASLRADMGANAAKFMMAKGIEGRANKIMNFIIRTLSDDR